MLDHIKSLPRHQQQQVIANLHKLPEREKEQLHNLLAEVTRREARAAAQGGFLDFVKAVYPGWIMGRHHEIMADAFERLERGEITRLAISMPPRFSKSEFASYMLPAWYLGKHPNQQIIEASHTAELAISFGRKVRNLIDSSIYQNIFTGVSLQQDSKSAGRWGTSQGGVYNAIGVNGAMAGRGANLVVLDDPFSEADIKSGGGDAIFEQVWQWFMTGPRQRLQPGGKICVVHTRWSKADLIGKLLKHAAANPESDQWTYIELPAILPSGKSLWPEFWPVEELLKVKAAISPIFWQAQYMQTPTTEEGAMIKREYWQDWDKPDPPEVSYTLISLDAAQEITARSDFSAITVWGVFEIKDPVTEKPVSNLILLDALNLRLEFPALKKAMLDQYLKWQPDVVLIEAKGSGSALFQELFAMGLPVSKYVPGKGSDKHSRMAAVSAVFESGLVWAPLSKTWTQDIIEQSAEFPNSDHDDLADSMSQAVLKFRAGNFLRLKHDIEEEEEDTRRKRVGADGRYY